MIHKLHQSQSKPWVPLLGFGFCRGNDAPSYHGFLYEGFFANLCIWCYHMLPLFWNISFITDSLYSDHYGDHCGIKHNSGLTMEEQNNTAKYNKTNNKTIKYQTIKIIKYKTKYQQNRTLYTHDPCSHHAWQSSNPQTELDPCVSHVNRACFHWVQTHLILNMSQWSRKLAQHRHPPS